MGRERSGPEKKGNRKTATKTPNVVAPGRPRGNTTTGAPQLTRQDTPVFLGGPAVSRGAATRRAGAPPDSAVFAPSPISRIVTVQPQIESPREDVLSESPSKLSTTAQSPQGSADDLRALVSRPSVADLIAQHLQLQELGVASSSCSSSAPLPTPGPAPLQARQKKAMMRSDSEMSGAAKQLAADLLLCPEAQASIASSKTGVTGGSGRRATIACGQEAREPGAVYKRIEAVGKGANGVVHKSINVQTGEIVAIKTMKKNVKIADDALQSFNKEIVLLRKLSHPNVVRLIDTFSDSEDLSLVMEYVDGGTLSGIVAKCGRFPEQLVAIYGAQIVEGLQYLHANNIVHRDLKGANILVTRDGIAKLADFGCAGALCNDMTKRITVVGSPFWMSPEVVSMSGTCDKSDIWSLGATLLELATCSPPYWGMPPVSAMFHIVQDDFPPIPEHLSPELADLLKSCFTKDPDARPSAMRIRQHPFFAKYSKPPCTLPDLVANVQSFNSVLSPLSLSSECGCETPASSDDEGGGGGTKGGALATAAVAAAAVEELGTKVSSLKEKLRRQRARRKRLELAVADLRDKNAHLQHQINERNEVSKHLLDFFNLVVLATRMAMASGGKPCPNFNTDVLHDRALAENVPWYMWPQWIPEQLSAVDHHPPPPPPPPPPQVV